VRGLAVLLCTIGCGRFDFDATRDAAMVDAALFAAQIAGALTCETDVAIAGVPRIDEMVWVDGGATQAIVALHHLDATHHELALYPLSIVQGAVVTSGVKTAYPVTDMIGLGAAVTATGFGVAVTSLVDDTLHAIQLDSQFAVLSDNPIANIGYATRPFAQSSSGTLVTGRDANGVVEVAIADPILSTLGAPIQIDPGPGDMPSIVPVGAEFLVAWSGTSACDIARVSATGSIVAGPTPLTPPGTCLQPLVVALGGGGIVYAVVSDSGSVWTAYAGAIDEALTTPTSPAAIGAVDSVPTAILDGGDRAHVAVRTTGDSRIVDVLASGASSTVGADFGLNGSDSDMETLANVGGALVHVRTENGELQLRKLCR
jgi:hypothetical protein